MGWLTVVVLAWLGWGFFVRPADGAMYSNDPRN